MIAPAVPAFLLAASVAIAAALLAAGPRHTTVRDPAFGLEDVAGRHVSVLGALAGFAVTAIVLLVTQGRNVLDPTGLAFTTVLAMFVVAYMGYFSSSVLYANVAKGTEDAPFDLAAAQYAGAAISLFSVFLGWLALKPLFEAFGLVTIATLTGWLLAGVVVVGYSQLATALYRSGYATARLVVLLAVFAAAATLAYALATSVVPGLRAPEATLQLTIVAFIAGLPAYAAMTALPVAAGRPRLAAILADRWHLAVVGYAQGVMVLVGFLLLAVLGLA